MGYYLRSILAIVALVVVSTRQREAQSKLDLAGLLRNELDVYNRDIRELFEQYDRQLQQAFAGFDPQSSSDILKLERHPLCGLVVIVDDKGLKGSVRHPGPEQIAMMDSSLVLDVVTWIRDSNFTGRDATGNSYGQSVQNSVQNSVQTATQSAFSHRPNHNPQPQPPAPQLPSALPQATSSRLAPSQSSRGSSIKWLKRGNVGQATNDAVQSTQNSLATEDSHWTTWYHGRGLVLGYWTQSLHETVTMVIVPRGRWLADLIAVLPDNRQSRSDALVQLVDVEGAVISQWGNLELAGSKLMDAEMPVDDPLEGWRLRMSLTLKPGRCV